MQLAAFSVKNYRSITNAYKLPIKNSTTLIGPNNEGKSNVLRALVTALDVLQNMGGIKIVGGRIRRVFFSNAAFRGSYVWEQDFPVSLQASMPDGESVFEITFRLTDKEVDEFYSEVGSALNGNLPIQLTLGTKAPGFKVIKRGPGATALSKKAESIAHFVAKRININYIPAVRTAEAAQDIVEKMVDTALRSVESDPAYKAALAEVEKIQQPILDKISDGIKETLQVFLPKVQQVRVATSTDARARALRRCSVVVDDGTPTSLSRKGDGVQSLAALSLMRQASQTTHTPMEFILAIEEPESHLHPSAIHQLKAVLSEMAQKSQVIMTTHCPLFVERTSISSNILVHQNKAVPAKNIAEIRGILGVRASDNLQHAEVIIVVEGEEDRRALRALFTYHSKSLGGALAQGSLGIESLQGATNLSYKLSTLREALCVTHSFLDYDAAGIKAAKKATADGLLEIKDVHYTTCEGLQEAEFEDLLDESLYASMLQKKYGVSTLSPKFKGSKKWSDRLAAAFKHQGKPWSDVIEAKVKDDVSTLIEDSPGNALNAHRRSIFDALVAELEDKLRVIEASKKSKN